ncbi:MAG: LysR family transcriptional regulator, partial [Pseudobdellovibrionaceae bacterium]
QSALSQRILNLEESLETSLFIRDRAGLKLTEVAQELVRYCQIKDSLEVDFVSKIKSQSSQELAGTVRIGGFSSIMRSVVLKSLSPLLEQHPKIQLQMATKEVFELPDMLKRGEIDYMVLSESLNREELEKVSLGVERNVLVQRKRYDGAEIYLDHDEKDQFTFQYFRMAKQKKKSLQRRYLDDIYGLIDGVRSGLGRAVLPLHLVQNEKNLEIINPELELEVPVDLYFYSQPYYSRLHSAVVEALKTSAQVHLT